MVKKIIELLHTAALTGPKIKKSGKVLKYILTTEGLKTPQRRFHKRICLLPLRLQHPQACKKPHKSEHSFFYLAPSENWEKINKANKKTLAD